VYIIHSETHMCGQMGGQHKLWKLDKKTADAAKKGLRASEQMPIHFLRYMTVLSPS
jgi:hypothetical protein